MKRVYFGENLYRDMAFDEAPAKPTAAAVADDDPEFAAALDGFAEGWKAARDKRRAARDAGRAEVDHRNDFKSADKPGAIDHALALDSAACLEFSEMFETNCHTGPGQADFADILGGRRA